VAFSFSGDQRITLNDGSYYVAVFEYTGGDSGNKMLIGGDSSSPTHAGNSCYYYLGGWTASSIDNIFYVYTYSTSSSPTYLFHSSIGTSLMDERFESDNYKLEVGTGYTFEANTPSISYFSATDSTMQDLCGYGGCYWAAFFTIDAEGNPSDTLYLVEISDDNWVTTYYVDGSSHAMTSSKDINDYLTKATWDASPYVAGLDIGTEYKIRARALNGDFSETEAGPDATATTAVPQQYLDINIAGNTWHSTDAPYSIELGEISKTSVTTASNYIWIDYGTNGWGGGTISIRDEYNGLYSTSNSSTIDSQSEDLSLENDGFGIKVDTSKRLPASGQPGYLRESTTYDTTGSDEVGAISTTPTTILCSIEESGGNCSTGTGSPINEGRSALWIKAKSSFTTPSATDYTDIITFSAIGSF
jgi:hypothetical protein